MLRSMLSNQSTEEERRTRILNMYSCVLCKCVLMKQAKGTTPGRDVHVCVCVSVHVYLYQRYMCMYLLDILCMYWNTEHWY